MKAWESDKKWSDKFIPFIRSVVGPHLLIPSSMEQDQTEAADLVVLRARDMTIACRVRRFGYAAKYPNQFTIRAKRDSGAKTEIEKIALGWGDWMFYGHATENDGEVNPWWLIDLHAFRAQLIFKASRESIKTGRTANGDGTYFLWFRIDSFADNPPLLVASSELESHRLFSR